MTLHLMNGTAAPREKSSDSCSVLTCGCAHTTGELQRWLQMCDAHFAEYAALHGAAKLSHIPNTEVPI